ncbi:MAG: type II and III secretion system protein family protein [Gammaproteobacteria bacterium]|nr:type II and III secretion system protein family protein [Gammaproteobacteria bacterium]
MLSSTRIVAAALLVLLAAAGATRPVHAQSAGFETLPTGASIDMSMPLFKSRVVVVDLPTSRVAVGNPDIADIVVIGPTQMYVLAKDIGTTNVMFWGRDNRLIGSINLEVVHDLDGLKTKLHQMMPSEAIEVYSAQRSIILKGRASNVLAMNAAVRIAEGYLAQIQTAKQAQQFEQESASRRPDKAVGSVINLIEVGGSQQVMLEVKVAEISRTELKRLNANFNAITKGTDGAFGGVNGGATFPDAVFVPGDVRLPAVPGGLPWGPAIDEFAPNPLNIVNQGLFATFINGNFLFNLALDAAKEHGLAKVLAEPTLTTLTGQEAEFLSGGQFPIPVSNGLNGVTVEFKKFGVGLKFLPVVLADGRINLKINVSVSELVDTGSLVLQAEGASTRTFVPSLKERSASATVELGDGQSMGLAGLLDDNLRELVTKFPGLGSVPVLGALFRSSQYQKGQTELVILVTPHLAKPVAPGSVTLPTDKFIEPSDADFYLWGRTEGTASASSGHQVK